MTGAATLAGLAKTSPLDELRAQNQDLMAALEDVQAQRDELEETNRGVMALYTQLSEELERTNQGVVALYAELEDKSARLREASEAKTRFLANVSHELRAPASSILGLARMLLDLGGPLDDEKRHQAELIRESGRDLLNLVNELLDLAKAESGRLEPEVVDVSLRGLLRRLRETLRPMAREGVALVVDDPDGVEILQTDELMLTRVLRNLLTNGLKFTERGEVRVGAHADGDHVLLRVSDTGIGIPAAEFERIFEEFHQVRGPMQTSVARHGAGPALRPEPGRHPRRRDVGAQRGRGGHGLRGPPPAPGPHPSGAGGHRRRRPRVPDHAARPPPRRRRGDRGGRRRLRRAGGGPAAAPRPAAARPADAGAEPARRSSGACAPPPTPRPRRSSWSVRPTRPGSTAWPWTSHA